MKVLGRSNHELKAETAHMKRQVVIGGLVGVALGGLITASFAHGVLSWRSAQGKAEAPAVEAPAHTDEDADDVDAAQSDARFVPHRPLRPGSQTTAKARAKAGQIAAAEVATARPAV